MQINLFSNDTPASPPEAADAPAPEPEPEPEPEPVSAFLSERPADLTDADTAAWSALSVLPGWAAMRRIPSLAHLVSELGLAVAYTDQRLVAKGHSAHEARMISGPRLMVPALAGASPWEAAAQILADAP